MALDPNTQKQISTFINAQFPRLYQEYGQPFIDFVTAYYEWMETEGPLYDSRRASEYTDIDTTVERFIVFFKDKYLPNIQLETRSNVELLVKHSLDVYRSRGTIRSIDLLFRLVFGVGAQVYYPFDDVFQPSSGEWIIPKYLEVSTQDDLQRFVGKEIIGVTSGAQAFVESWIRKKSGSKQIDVLYISALEGNFTLLERINTVNNPFDLQTCPTLIGSLTDITITGGGTGFEVGDVLDLTGTKGYGGRGRVANTLQITGAVNFTLTDGGYGYTANAEVLVSESVLSLHNVVPGANQIGQPNFYTIFETISQPLANINYESAVGGHFANNDALFTYYGNGSVMGTGTVLASADGDSTNGQIFVAVLSGNLQSNVIYNTGNVVTADVPVVAGYTDITASGNVISESASLTLTFNTLTGAFQRGERLVNGVTTSGTLDTIVIGGASATVGLSGRVGVWEPGTTVTGQTTGATANLVSLNLAIGITDLVNSFYADIRAPLVSSTSNNYAILPSLNQGSGATFSISPSLLYPEVVHINTDLILPYVGVLLSSGAYGFPAFPTANLATPLSVALSYVDYTVGRIAALVGLTPGTGYTIAPQVRVYEPIAFPSRIVESQVATISGATTAFIAGDVITQSATSARGLILSANSSVVVMKKLSLFNGFIATANSTTTIVATGTGTSANLLTIEDMQYSVPENISQTYLGLNAVINANTSAANGTITNLQVIDSGWGYEPGESITVTSNNITATGEAVLLNQGVGQGFYRTEDGFLSDIKKIQDNDYYQVSSYDVRASVAFEHYKDMLKALLHVAGTKAFGTFVHRSVASARLNVLPSLVQHSINKSVNLDPVVIASAGIVTVTASADPLIVGVGVSAHAGVGMISITANTTLSGASASASAGSLSDAVTITANGVGATSHAGTVTTTISSNVAITGVAATASAGTVTFSIIEDDAGPPELPDGYRFLLDADDEYIRNANGNYIIVPLPSPSLGYRFLVDADDDYILNANGDFIEVPYDGDMALPAGAIGIADFVQGGYRWDTSALHANDVVVTTSSIVPGRGLILPENTPMDEIIGSFATYLKAADWTIVLEYYRHNDFCEPLHIQNANNSIRMGFEDAEGPGGDDGFFTYDWVPGVGERDVFSHPGDGLERVNHVVAITRTNARIALSYDGRAVVNNNPAAFQNTFSAGVTQVWTGGEVQAGNSSVAFGDNMILGRLVVYPPQLDAALPGLSQVLVLPPVPHFTGPDNDNFANAYELTIFNSFDGYNNNVYTDWFNYTVDATIQHGEPNHCGFGLTHSIWFKFTAPETKTYHMFPSFDDSSLGILSVYTGSALNALTIVTEQVNWDLNWITSFEATAGTTYYIALDANAPTGEFDIAVSDEEEKLWPERSTWYDILPTADRIWSARYYGPNWTTNPPTQRQLPTAQYVQDDTLGDQISIGAFVIGPMFDDVNYVYYMDFDQLVVIRVSKNTSPGYGNDVASTFEVLEFSDFVGYFPNNDAIHSYVIIGSTLYFAWVGPNGVDANRYKFIIIDLAAWDVSAITTYNWWTDIGDSNVDFPSNWALEITDNGTIIIATQIFNPVGRVFYSHIASPSVWNHIDLTVKPAYGASSNNWVYCAEYGGFNVAGRRHNMIVLDCSSGTPVASYANLIAKDSNIVNLSQRLVNPDIFCSPTHLFVPCNYTRQNPYTVQEGDNYLARLEHGTLNYANGRFMGEIMYAAGELSVMHAKYFDGKLYMTMIDEAYDGRVIIIDEDLNPASSTLYPATGAIPPNNNFANATPISVGGTANGNLFYANMEVGEPVPSWAGSNTYTWAKNKGHSVWYDFTAPATKTYTINVAGVYPWEGPNHSVQVYTGASVGALTEIVSQADRIATYPNPATVQLAATSGTTYHISIRHDMTNGFQGFTGQVEAGAYVITVLLSANTTATGVSATTHAGTVTVTT